MGGSIEHQMTEIHCFVDDYLRARPALSGRRRSPHSSPRFADAEGITIALLQGPLGAASLKKAYRMAANNRAAGFPCPCRLTRISQWWHQFIDRVFSRSWNGLWNTLNLEVLHYNLVHAGVVTA
jgi:hypothetical protein